MTSNELDARNQSEKMGYHILGEYDEANGEFFSVELTLAEKEELLSAMRTWEGYIKDYSDTNEEEEERTAAFVSLWKKLFGSHSR